MNDKEFSEKLIPLLKERYGNKVAFILGVVTELRPRAYAVNMTSNVEGEARTKILKFMNKADQGSNNGIYMVDQNGDLL